MPSLTVIGGGAAGITAALQAAACGWKVTLCEARSKLGGKLSSFTDKDTGLVFDYGEHILTQGYRDTLKLLQMIGADNSVVFQRKLDVSFYYPDLGHSKLRAGNLPIPFDSIASILNFKPLPFRRRLQFINNLRRLIRMKNDSQLSLSEFLRTVNPEEQKFFWDPFILSTMNCTTEDADIDLLRTVITDGFMAGGGLGFFKNHHLTIFHNLALKKLLDTGVDVRPNYKLRIIKHNGSRISSIGDGNNSIASDRYIFALQPGILRKILEFNNIDKNIFGVGSPVKYASICNVHLVTKNKIFPDDFGCLLETLPQWFFSRIKTIGEEKLYHYNLVISAAEKFINRDDDIEGRCIEDLNKLGANLQVEEILFLKTIWDRKATVKLSRSFPAGRPGPSTELVNAFIAGDWTNTGLPATIESAVRSGFNAFTAAADNSFNRGDV